jgi:hypothetical protein
MTSAHEAPEIDAELRIAGMAVLLQHATIGRDRFAFDLRASAGIAWTHVTGTVSG